MNCLVTTLGKAWHTNTPNASGHGSYRTAQYMFSNTEISEPTTFFGLALYRHLQTNGANIGKIVVLGTRGSMWDALLDAHPDILRDDANAPLLDLYEAVDGEGVSDDMLEKLSCAVGRAMGVPVSCLAIPYGKDAIEQIDILSCVRRATEGTDKVFLDVTHGMRHLPMMTLVSAFLVGHDAHSILTAGVYYGVLEMKGDADSAPVVKLDGLLAVEEWIEAMTVFKTSGNVSRLAKIPGLDAELSRLLNEYQFFEQMNNVARSRKCAQKIQQLLDSLPPEGLMFKNELHRMFDWANGENYAHRQYDQARNAFDNGDYLRAVLLLNESVITSEIHSGAGDILKYEVREEARKRLDKLRDDAWRLLANLRNTLAHGSSATGGIAHSIQRMRDNETEFRKEMETLFKWARNRSAER